MAVGTASEIISAKHALSGAEEKLHGEPGGLRVPFNIAALTGGSGASTSSTVTMSTGHRSPPSQPIVNAMGEGEFSQLPAVTPPFLQRAAFYLGPVFHEVQSPVTPSAGDKKTDLT